MWQARWEGCCFCMSELAFGDGLGFCWWRSASLSYFSAKAETLPRSDHQQNRVRRKLHAGLLVAVAAVGLLAQPAPGTLTQANADLQAGEADEALRLLNTLSPSAEAHNLRCRVLFSLERWDDAAAECAQAVAMDP